MTSSAKRTRRSPKELIADLEAKIAQGRQRAERKKAKKDPSLRHMTAAVRSIDKALAESKDTATRQALGEARSTLAACLALNGAAPSTGGQRQRAVRPAQGKEVNVKAVLKHVAGNPGSRCAQIAAALGAESKAVSPVLKDLKAQGKVRSKGRARGTTYFAKAAR